MLGDGVIRVQLCPAKKRGMPQKHVVAPAIMDWLNRMSPATAMLKHTRDLYLSPRRAGGWKSDSGDNYVEAARAGDPRILLDAIVWVTCQLETIRVEIEQVVEPPATAALPGSSEKIDEMRVRQERFLSLHSKDDAQRS